MPDTDQIAESEKRAGRITDWPWHKFARADELTIELRSLLEQWSTTEMIWSEQVRQDDLTIRLVLKLARPFPYLEMSLRLGEILHNIRSALDAIVWEMAHVLGTPPANPQAIQFPAARTQAAWSSVAGNLRTLPATVLERVKENQPFQFPEPDFHIFSVLSKLSNDDKHRSTVMATVSFHETDWAVAWSAGPGGYEVRMEPTVGPIQFLDGSVLGLIISEEPLRLAEGRGRISLRWQVAHESETIGLAHLLDALAGVRRIANEIVFDDPDARPPINIS